MTLIAIAAVDNGIRWTSDGRKVSTARSLGALLDQLARPHALICDPTFYDGLADVRRHLERWLSESGGHRLVPINDAARSVLEAAAGSAIGGRGVARLFAVATLGADGLDRDVARRFPIVDVRRALEVVHLVDLYGNTEKAFAAAVNAAGRFASLDTQSQRVLGDGVDYRRDVLLAAWRAGSVAPNRRDFDSLLGLTAEAHGPLTRTIRAWYAARNSADGWGPGAALTWPEYRRALRAIFHRVIEHRRQAAA